MALHELIVEIASHPAVIDREPEQPGDVPQTFANIRKAQKLLMYSP